MSKFDKRHLSFQLQKKECLGREDLSRKGSIDEPIRNLVDTINGHLHYYTTSTCSGRITLIEKPHEQSGIKRGSRFHLNSHKHISPNDLSEVVDTYIKANKTDNDKCLWLKFEPFILHIQCIDLDRARILLNISLATGCRNSGVTLGKQEKIMIAIRSASSMEVPIYSGLRFEFDRNYLRFLAEECNRRLSENFSRLEKLQAALEEELTKPIDATWGKPTKTHVISFSPS